MKGESAIRGTVSSKDGAVKAVKRLLVSFYRRQRKVYIESSSEICQKRWWRFYRAAKQSAGTPLAGWAPGKEFARA